MVVRQANYCGAHSVCNTVRVRARAGCGAATARAAKQINTYEFNLFY